MCGVGFTGNPCYWVQEYRRQQSEIDVFSKVPLIDELLQLTLPSIQAQSIISLTWNEWNCKVMIDPVGAVRDQVSYTFFGYGLG